MFSVEYWILLRTFSLNIYSPYRPYYVTRTSANGSAVCWSRDNREGGKGGEGVRRGDFIGSEKDNTVRIDYSV